MRKISRKDALQKRQHTFFTGKPCKNGHVAARNVKTYRCIECKREWEQQWRKDNPEKDKKIRAKEVRKNAEGYKRRFNEYANRKGKEYLKKLRQEYRQNNKEQVLESCNKRRAQTMQAMPLWYDKSACVLVYEEAARLTKETGVLHHVDHIIPLNNDSVCGLHCADNLQAIPATDNLKKSNLYGE